MTAKTPQRPGLWEPAFTPATAAEVRNLAEPKVSPDGRWVAYLESYDGRGALMLVPRPGGPARVLTTDPPAALVAAYGGGAFDWSPDGRWVVYSAADGKLWAVPVAGGRAWRLAEGEGRQRAPAFSPDGQLVAFVAEREDAADVAVVEFAPGVTGWPWRASAGADFVLDPAFSPDGRFLVWQEWDRPNMAWDGSRIVRLDLAVRERRVVAGGDEVAVTQPRYSPDGRYLTFLCDAHGWLNLWVADPDGGNPRPLVPEQFEAGPPAWGPGARTYAWSPDGRRLVYARNEAGHWRLKLVAVDEGASPRPIGDPDLPGSFSALSWAPDGTEVIGLYSGAAVPPQVVAVNPADGGRRVLAVGAPAGFENLGLVWPEHISWRALEGVTVYGQFYRPVRDPAPYRPPLLVDIHGGPTGQRGARWDPVLQYFLQRGWAVLCPEYRGSTGYGRAYTQALRGNWGVHDVHDTLAGIEHLARAGLVDPDRVAVMGGSAGGYTVLMLLALASDRVKAGVDLFGVTDLLALAETTHRLEAHYTDTLIGPLPEAYPKYRERSPIHLAHKIRRPLLVLQGAEDRVVTREQSDALVQAVRAAGGTVEYQVYPGEGHGWVRAATIRDALSRIDRFLVKHVILTS